MERADQIFPGARINTGLSANRAVRHGKQSRGNLDVGNATVINRRDKSGDITDHAAPKTDYERLTVQSSGNHLLADRSGLLKCLRFLTRRDSDQRWLKAG